MTTAVLSQKSQDLLDAIMANPSNTAAQIAKFMGISISQVTGGLAGLKKSGLVEVNDGILTATDEAEFQFGSPKAAAPSVGAVTTSFPTVESARASLTTETTEALSTASDDDEDGDATTIGATDTDAGEVEMKGIDSIASFISSAVPPAATKKKAGGSKKSDSPAVETKASKALAVFEANMDKPRKEIMAALMAPEVGLTQHGANTYLYNMRKKANMVKSRTPKVEGETVTTEATTETTDVDSTAEVADTASSTADAV